VSSLLFFAITSQSNFLPLYNCQSQNVTQTPLQGILGMSQVSYAIYDTYPIGLGQTFALQLCESGGQMWIGTANSSYYTSGPNNVAILGAYPHTYYNVSIAGLSLGGVTISTSLSSGIVDSGTTLIYLPSSAYTAFLSQLSSNPVFSSTFSELIANPTGCYPSPDYTTAQLNEQLPSMTWSIGSSPTIYTYTLTPVDSYLRQLVISGQLCYSLGIAASPSSSSVQTILGWTFMNQFITFFGGDFVGFAPSVSCQNVWQVTSWSSCFAPCTQTRTATCVNYLGQTVPSNSCHTAPPATSQSCTNGPCGLFCPADDVTGNASWPESSASSTNKAHCNAGYVGSPTRTCQSDGIWASTIGGIPCTRENPSFLHIFFIFY